jgi:cobalt-zinc-cadmium efflux system outer membrane protein
MDAVHARIGDVAEHGRFIDVLADSGQQAPESLDVSDGVTLPEGEVLALFYNANLRVARLEAGVALAGFENAGLWQDPVFGFNGAQVLTPGNDLEYGATLGLTLPVSGRLAVAKDRAGAAYEVQLRRIVDAEWRLRVSLRQAWYEWTAAERRRQLLEGVIEQIERIGAIAARLKEAGAMREADERLIRIELVGRRAELTAARLASQQVRVRLLWLMGLPSDVPLDLRTIQALPSTPPDGDVAERVVAANTELAVLQAEYRVAEESLRLAVRKQYPDVGLGAGYGSEDGDRRLLFGFTFPIPILNRNRAEIAAAAARREVTRGTADAALERIVREAKQLELTLGAARVQRGQLTGQLVPLLSKQSNSIEALAELGDVDMFLLLETVRRQFSAQSRLIALEQAESEAAAGLSLLLGPPNQSSPTSTDDISLPPSGVQAVGTSTEETSR